MNVDITEGQIPSGGWTQAEIDAVEAVKARYRRLKNLVLDRVDLVTAPANQGAWVALMKSADQVRVIKIDEARRRAYGFASVSTVKGEELVDAHGDVIAPEDLEEAAATFRGSVGVNHQGDAIGEIFESLYLDATKAEAMGVSGADGFAGWWIGVQLPPGPVWEDVKAGKLPAFSVQGRAMSEPLEKHAAPVENGSSQPEDPARAEFFKAEVERIRKGREATVTATPAHLLAEAKVRKARERLEKLQDELRGLER